MDTYEQLVRNELEDANAMLDLNEKLTMNVKNITEIGTNSSTTSNRSNISVVCSWKTKRAWKDEDESGESSFWTLK